MLIPNQLDLQEECSDVLYITGFTKSNSKEDIQNFISSSTISTTTNITKPPDNNQQQGEGTTSPTPYMELKIGGEGRQSSSVWIRYPTIKIAMQYQHIFHQKLNTIDNISILMCRFELGFCIETGKRLVSRKSIHTTLIRRPMIVSSARTNTIHKAKSKNKINNNNNSKSKPKVTYNSNSILVGNTSYPFPTGLYLTRLLSILQKYSHDQDNNNNNNPLITLISNTSLFSNITKYNKEISESMAMVDALERSFKLCLGTSTSSFMTMATKRNHCHCHCRVCCLGDGKYPFTSSLLALHYPYKTWEFISIDPILQPLHDIRNYNHNINVIQINTKSEDYIIPSDNNNDMLHIVIACHSHAPFQEFWDRLVTISKSKSNSSVICIVMACCAEYSTLSSNILPIFEFDDYEVYSPKRKIQIFYHK